MADEETIVAKPASHPVATGLLVASTVGVLLNIVVVWGELFTSYLPTDPKQQRPTVAWKGDKPHNPLKYAKDERIIHNYFEIDFKNKKIDDDLELKSDGG
jgi:hypothetical protein